MALEVKAFICMFILSLVALAASGKPPQVPCYFIFGDSLVDHGNNNDLPTKAKANFPPYGIDFPEGPTRRFTNGRNIADFIAEFIGLNEYIQPYAAVKHKLNLRGLNYASGSARIRSETGQHMGKRFSLQHQLVHHGLTVVRLKLFFGNSKLAEDHLSKCLYTVGMGSNDYINNYLMPQFYPTGRFYTPDQFTTLLLSQYSQQLKELHLKYGARKVGVFGVGYIGCTPADISIYGADESSCVDMINKAVVSFNQQLRNIVGDLNNAFSDAKFIYIDPPLGYAGPKITDTPCCPISKTVAKGQCALNTIACSNRTDYVFWDAFHPTETAIRADAINAYSTMAPLFTTTSTVDTTTELLGLRNENESISSICVHVA